MKTNKQLFISLVVLFIVGIIIVLMAIYEFFYVSGASMEPAYHDGNIVLVRTQTNQTYTRGDTVVYRTGESMSMKRIIGLPGETVAILDMRVYIDGVVLEESYLDPDIHTCIPIDCSSELSREILLPAETYFVLGDHRMSSRDSRDCIEGVLCPESGFRTVSQSDIYGKVVRNLPSWLSILLTSQQA